MITEKNQLNASIEAAPWLQKTSLCPFCKHHSVLVCSIKEGTYRPRYCIVCGAACGGHGKTPCTEKDIRHRNTWRLCRAAINGYPAKHFRLHKALGIDMLTERKDIRGIIQMFSDMSVPLFRKCLQRTGTGQGIRSRPYYHGSRTWTALQSFPGRLSGLWAIPGILDPEVHVITGDLAEPVYRFWYKVTCSETVAVYDDWHQMMADRSATIDFGFEEPVSVCLDLSSMVQS